jgi:hypothetical protein
MSAATARRRGLRGPASALPHLLTPAASDDDTEWWR